MEISSAATSETSVSDLLEDHFDSLGDLEISPRNNNVAEPSVPATAAAALPSPSISENSAKENNPTNEKIHKVCY